MTAAADRDAKTEKALARSREIRERGQRQVQEACERLAAARRRSRASARFWSPGQDLVAGPTGARMQIENSKRARARLAVLAAKLAQTEETVARIQEEMAGRDSRRAAQYRQAADDARQAAGRAREIQRSAGSDSR